MLQPIIECFSFHGSGFLLYCSGTWSGSIQKVHIALQEIQGVASICVEWPFNYLVR